MIEWLETYFCKKENITLFMVTHDRFFLERVCNEIIELDNGHIPDKGTNGYLEKEEEHASEKFKCGQGKNLFGKIRMDATSTGSERTTKSKSRQKIFTRLKDKSTKAAGSGTKWN
jgi:ATP-binding cassette subfamily F protein uup